MFTKEYIKKLIEKYEIDEDDGIKSCIEQIEYKQADLFSDGIIEYKELEQLKIHYYKKYIERFEESKEQ